MSQAGWNTQVKNAFDPEEIRVMKSQAGSYILLGGAKMARVFFAHGLVDEYHPMIHPTAIGMGNAIFDGMSTLPRLEMQAIDRLASGGVAINYKVLKD
jgi:dihydrofolate reductase